MSSPMYLKDKMHEGHSDERELKWVVRPQLRLKVTTARGATAMSVHLQWMVVQNCSSFLIKENKRTYSTDPNNLKARNSFRYNGLIHHMTVDVELAANGKGVLVVMKRRSGQRKPATCLLRADHHQQECSRHAQQHQTHDTQDQVPARPASAILRSQKPVMVKRKRI
ncbi:60S ribosomal protein L28 [Saguinus oedipus]|uniref:Large ribosomal subunit protein eL28 n=1 Tax=Saguinus oedipus TaxID=9490 RepID=A0ABQ9W5R7_SAGOE|nr:60S ribosomal protein L28 [Saguinus oedipus]